MVNLSIDIGAMRFKEFLQMEEAGASGGGDNGLMGFAVPSSVRKPSDGQPFKTFLSPTAGQTPRGNSGGGMGGAGAAGGTPPPVNGTPAKMMRKRMKRK
jgi:hypothetical protein